VGIERAQSVRVGRGPEADVPVGAHQDRACGSQPAPAGVAGGIAYLHQPAPPVPQALDGRVVGAVGAAEEKKVMASARERGPVRLAVAGGGCHRRRRARRVLADERAARVGNIQHRA
jgi:hypothetical protein